MGNKREAVPLKFELPELQIYISSPRTSVPYTEEGFHSAVAQSLGNYFKTISQGNVTTI